MIPVCGSGRANEEGKFLSEKQRLDVKQQLIDIQQEIISNNYITQLDAPEGYIEKYFDDLVTKENVVPDIMGCSAGKTCLALQQNGKVGFCLMNRSPIGDLKNQKFDEIFSNSIEKAKQNKLTFCANCKHNKVCYGPCMISNNSCECNEEREYMVNKILKI